MDALAQVELMNNSGYFSLEFGLFLRKLCAILYAIQIVEAILLAYFLWANKRRSAYRSIALFMLLQAIGNLYLVYLLVDYSPVRLVKFAFLPLAIAVLLADITGGFVILMIRRESRLARKA
ncbi:MAG: hypothetical protein ACRC8A_13320 [Microcoleaceae cyanobacterium]